MSAYSVLDANEQEGAGPDPVQVLALVAATVPLPNSTSAALRLTCRATKLAVDHAKNYLELRFEKMEAVRLGDNPLTSGLTLLHFTCQNPTISDFNVSDACLLALHNCETLESLSFGYMVIQPSDFLEAMTTLGSQHWPKLENLIIHCTPGTVRRINVENMPELKHLHLSGRLEPGDVAALHHCTRLTSRLEVLALGASGSKQDAGAMFEEVSKLLQSTSKLRSLTLSLLYCRDASFLAAAELPCLEFLSLHGFDKLSFEPLVLVERPHLEGLHLHSIMPRATDLLPVLTSNWALPALTDLCLGGFVMRDWGFLREIELKTLQSLSLTECWMTTADLAHVGAAAARLPVLQKLALMPINIEDEGETPFDAAAAMRALLSGPPLPRLKALGTGEQLEDNDASLKCLIEFADKVPQLEGIEMERGWISADGLAALTAAGRRGRWPKLQHLVINEFVGENQYDSIKELIGVFPDLVLRITHRRAVAVGW